MIHTWYEAGRLWTIFTFYEPVILAVPFPSVDTGGINFGIGNYSVESGSASNG